jgi:hypothetical protein
LCVRSPDIVPGFLFGLSPATEKIMRISSCIVATLLLLSPSALCAQQKSPQSALGLPEDALLWSVQQDGKTTLMTCNSSKCGGKSALISYMYLQGQTEISPDAFKNYLIQLETARAGMDGSRTEQLAASNLSEGKNLHYKVTELITNSHGSEYMIEGYASRSGQAVTLESSSPDRATAEKNYSFLFGLTKRTK